MVFLTQDPSQLPPASLVAEKLLGTSVFVNWPMMHEAKVNDWDKDRTIARQHLSYALDVRISFNFREGSVFFLSSSLHFSANIRWWP